MGPHAHAIPAELLKQVQDGPGAAPGEARELPDHEPVELVTVGERLDAAQVRVVSDPDTRDPISPATTRPSDAASLGISSSCRV